MRSQKYTLNLAGNGSQRLLCIGSFFKILSSSGAVRVESDFGNLSGLTAGQGLKDTPFNFLYVVDESGGANVVVIMVADREFIDAALSTVTMLTNKAPQSAAGVQGLVTVTNASTSIIAANANRQYLFIQNNDAAGIVYLNLVGAAATVAAGVVLKPGEDFTFPQTVLTTEVRAIGSIVSNPNVLVVEG